jgi:protein-disulfide isomerase
MLIAAAPAAEPSFSEPQKTEIEKIIRDYLVSHPEVLQEAIGELEKRQVAADTEKTKAAVAANAETLFRSNRHVVLGNAKGDVTMVEFFDYNCGFCKGAMAAMMDLMKDDPKLRVVLKEFPVLGPGSVEAARWPSPCACRTRPARSISTSIKSCSAAAARPTRRARSRSPRRSGWT